MRERMRAEARMLEIVEDIPKPAPDRRRPVALFLRAPIRSI